MICLGQKKSLLNISFLWAKFEQQASREKTYEIWNSMTSFTAHGKNTSFMTENPER